MSLVLAKSKVGHDKNRVYVVVESHEDTAVLADGTHRTMARPKIKKWKHLQVIKSLTQELRSLAENPLDDALIKKILKTYQNNHEDRKEI